MCDAKEKEGCDDINNKSLIAHPTRDAAVFLDLSMNLVIVESNAKS